MLEIIAKEQEKGTLAGVIVQFGGQTPLKLANGLRDAGVPILGTSADAIDLAEDRKRFQKLLDELSLKQPRNATAMTAEEAVDRGARHRLSGDPAPLLCAGRARHGGGGRRSAS